MKKYLKCYKLLSLMVWLLFVSTILFLSGCKKWLDVTPKDKVSQGVLFNSEQGFKDALTSVYLNMDKSTSTGLSFGLYTSDLSMGLLSVLSNTYTNASSITTNNSIYPLAYTYSYNNTTLKAEILAIWKTLYFNVANINNLLNQIDAKKDIFTGNNYKIVKGEALALRAMLLFDALRLWGESPVSGANKPAIPYVTKFDILATPFSTVNEAADLCIKDLQMARDILATTDTTQVFKGTTDLFLSYTQNRYNFWAVEALMSRVFLFRNNLDSAFIYANAVIGSNKFPLSTTNVASNANAVRDRLFSKENIFSLYSTNLLAINTGLFGGTSSASFQLNAAARTSLYGTPAADNVDWRNTSWFDLNPSSVTVPSKFFQDANLPYELKGQVPLIKVPEMYYIAAECLKNQGNITQGVEYINAVRRARGLQNINNTITGDSLTNLITKEYRKEFLGEGQTFLYFKRLNLNLQTAAGLNFVPPPDAYNFPIPDLEKEYR
jgi:hypothetical protein